MGLYEALLRMDPSPVVELNLAAAIAMDRGSKHGPATGLAMMDALVADGRLTDYPHLHAGRADLLRRLGRWPEAADAYERAIALTANAAERDFLERRLHDVRTVAADGSRPH